MPAHASIANVMMKASELTKAVAEFAGAEHHDSKTSDAPAKPTRTKEQKAMHKLMMEERTAKRKKTQMNWLTENKSADQVQQFNDELVALQEARNTAKLAATDSGKKGKELSQMKNKAHTEFVKNVRALLVKYGVPQVPHEVSADTSIQAGMEAEMDHDLWMERPQGYPMRDSLRYL
jgi:hypothetical protein